jgi:hypothetical protein
MITGMKQSLYRNYSGILPQRHQGTKIMEVCFIIAFLMRLRRINAKSPLFNLYSFLFGSLCLGGSIVTLYLR